MLDILTRFFKKPAEETREKVPEGVCPNCWGEQEYDHKIRVMYEDKQIDVNNHEENYAFIKDFVVNYVDGIKLKKDEDKLVCPSCQKEHKH